MCAASSFDLNVSVYNFYFLIITCTSHLKKINDSILSLLCFQGHYLVQYHELFGHDSVIISELCFEFSLVHNRLLYGILFYCRYTLRNAEHWLCLEKNLEIYEGHIYKQNTEDSKLEGEGLLINEDGVSKIFRQDNLPLSETTSEITSKIPDLGEMSLEAREYMLRLQSCLSSVRKVCTSWVSWIS